MTLKYNPLLGTGLDNIGSTSTEKARYINFVVGTASDPNASTFDYTTDGTADEVQINAALAALPSAGGSVLIRAGSYTIADSILCPSNSTLFIGDGVTIKPVNNFAPTSTTVDGNVVRAFIRNSDHASGNTNIRIVGPGLVSASGVTLGTNVANEPCYVGIMFNKTTFSKVEGLRISDIMYGEGSAEINTPTVVRQYGVFFAESNDCDVIDCTISRINNDSVSIRRNSNRCKVDRCNLSYSHLGHAAGQDGSGAALIFGDNGTGRAYGNQWTNNTVLGDAAYATTAIGGIVTHGNVDSLISNNTIIDCGVGIGFVGDCERCLASDNVIVDPRFKGIWLRTDASGSNFYNELKGNKIKMHSSCPIGIYLESSTAGLSVTGASISDNHILGADAVGGSGTQVGIQMDTSTSTGLLQDIIIKDNHIYLCGQAGIYVDTLTSGAIAQRIFISGGHIRNCGYGIELGRTSSGTLTIGTINDISISSSRTQIGSSGISPRGIQWLAASFYTVTAGRIRVNGIAIRETASTSSANRISFCDTTSSGTVAPELYGASSRASGYDYGYTGGTGDIVFSAAPIFTGPIGINVSTPLATSNGLDIASGGTPSLMLGADNAATTRTNSTNKVARVACVHYTSASQLPSAVLIASNTSTANTLAIGGGNSSFNAATGILFYTDVNNTTPTGTLRMTIDSAGVVSIAGSLTIGTALAIAQGGTGATTAYGAYDNINSAEASIASATTTDIGAATSNKVSITGTTTITSFGTKTAGTVRYGRFTGALTLTHNATSLILPGGANITTVAGDRFIAVSLGSGNWVVYSYNKATWTGSGSQVMATSPTLTTPTIGVATATSVNKWAFTAPTTAATITAGADNCTYTLPGQTCNIGYLEINQNSKSADYTCVLSDSGKHIFHPSADTTARTFTIPANGSVAYPIGTCISFINQNGAGVVTIVVTTDTMRLAGTGSTGSRSLAANGVATATKVTSTEWIINGTGLT